MTTHTNPVAYTELHTHDTSRARAFYGELLGWKGEEVPTPSGPYTMFQALLAGMTTSKDGIPVGWVPYVNVSDIGASTKRAKALGAEILRDCITIEEGTFSVVRDPTGAVVGLWQKK
jgi:predicted enzyme related to lactoylglutathione lyase